MVPVTSTAPTTAVGVRELNPREHAICKANYARRDERPCPLFKATGEGAEKKLTFDHPYPGLALVLSMNAMGTASDSFWAGLVGQLATMDGLDHRRAQPLNFAMSAVNGLAPRDEGEAMFAAQMAAVHVAMMRAAQRLAKAVTIEEQDSASNMFNKLARTYATQMEALKRNRTTGEQVVRVHRAAKAEYMHYDLGPTSVAIEDIPGSGVFDIALKTRTTGDTLRIGVNLHLNP